VAGVGLYDHWAAGERTSSEIILKVVNDLIDDHGMDILENRSCRGKKTSGLGASKSLRGSG
jgi:hypothetical protein